MKKRLHVNRHNVAHNKKVHFLDKPPFSVKTYKGNTKGHVVTIQGPCALVSEPTRPLSCGATAWIETESPVEVMEVTKEGRIIRTRIE